MAVLSSGCRGDASAMLELFVLLLAALRAACRQRGDLVAENLLLRHQLAVLTRPTRRRRARFRRPDKLLWVLVRRLRRDWRRHLVVVTPETVVRWHRPAGACSGAGARVPAVGRPRLSPEVRELIARMSRDNPLWGSGAHPGRAAQAGHRRQQPLHPPLPRGAGRAPPPEPDLAHLPARTTRTAIWAADLFIVQTLTFKTLYVLLFITPRPPRAGAPGGHGAPHRRVGVAPAGRGDAVGPPAEAPHPRPGRASTAATSGRGRRRSASRRCSPRCGRPGPTPSPSG